MMTKRKSTLLQVLVFLGICGVLIGVLMLTGCGNSTEVNNQGRVQIGDSISLEDIAFEESDYFMTSDLKNMTNQEVFDIMLETPNAVFGLLNLVDEVMLRGNVEIDEANTVGFLEEFKADIPDFDDWMMQAGFGSEAEIIRILELEELRVAAVRDSVVVTDDEVQQMFDEWVGDDDEIEFEDFRDDIYDFLYGEAIGEIIFEELARLRFESGLMIYHDILEQAYIDYLEMAMIDIETNPSTTPSSPEVIAHINGVDITIGQLFDGLSSEIGMDIVFMELDEEIIALASLEELLEPSYEELRIIYEQMSAAQADSYEQLYNEIDSLAMGSHILVEDYDFALELIAQLEDADDFEELFAELAALYSNCPSGERAGELGMWARGQMVEPFDNAFFDLDMGEFTTTPVETDFGYHIIFRPTPELDLPEFEEIREALIEEEIMRQMQMPGLVNEIMMDLRQEAGVTFTNPTLQARFQSFINN